MDSTAKELLREIAHAFADVRRGNGMTWLEGEALDCDRCATPAELAAARSLDTDHRWQDVPDERFERYPSAVAFLDAEGLRYYLPAVMTWALRTKSGVTEEQLLNLLNDKERQAWLEGMLSLRQLRVTADWVWYVTETWPLKDGWIGDIREFWDRYRHVPRK